MPANPIISIPANYAIPKLDGGVYKVPSAAHLANAITGLSITRLDRDNFGGSLASCITTVSGVPSSPTAGEFALDRSLSPPVLKFFDGGGWVSVWHVGATAPSVNVPYPWFDTNINVLRVYGTVEGVAGWHPVDPGYRLLNNAEAGYNAVAGAPVAWNSGTGSASSFVRSKVTKSPNVCGVLMEDTSTGSSGVVAMVGSNATVYVNVDPDDDFGAVAIGDLLAVWAGYDTEPAITPGAGEVARTVGGLPTASSYHYLLTSGYSGGYPLGAFAIALSAKDASNQVMARMLPCVGQGMYVKLEQTSLGGMTLASTTDVDISSYYLNPKHYPSVLACVHAETQMTAATSEERTFKLYPDRFATSNPVYQCSVWGAGAGVKGTVSHGPIMVPTTSSDSFLSGSTGVEPGKYFAYNLTGIGGDFYTKNLFLHGYVY